MPDIKWVGKHIEVKPPRKPKKITGTRFGAILNLSQWSSPFEAWCAITRVYEKPFEETKYTTAGKTIEPKQAEYMQNAYFMKNMVWPKDLYGADPFKTTYGDFFPQTQVFGGMWDYYLQDNGKPVAVLEMKTTKRVEDWEHDIPEHYALQAALYARLLGVDQVYMVCSFLTEKDYDHPEKYVCSSDNTIVRPFKTWERYPTFEHDYFEKALDWWNTYVTTGISPDYDDKKDADILKALKTDSVTPDASIDDMVKEAEIIKVRMDAIKGTIAADEERYKVLLDAIKAYGIKQMEQDGTFTKVVIPGQLFSWELTTKKLQTVDKAAMKKDGIYDKYVTVTTSYALSPKDKKEGN